MVDTHDAFDCQPFPFPACEYLVPPTGPIFLPSTDHRSEAYYYWYMTRRPMSSADVNRTGSPTNVANESVFLASSESETNDDNHGTEDLGPTVLPYAYANPDAYDTPRASLSYDFNSSDDDMSFSYTQNNSDSDDGSLSGYCTDAGDEVALLKAPRDTPVTPIDLTHQADKIIDLTSSRDEDVPSNSPVVHSAAGQLFSDTSDDTRPDDNSQRLPVARVLDIPDDEIVNQDNELDEWEWDITEDQAFLSLGLPDACIFTGQAMAFGQPP